MIGGLTRATSLLAMATVATAIASTNVKAADLGGNCCADLEERVAELEATTARKGNRKVKLTVSGQVNEALLFWDDGYERNVYVVSNNAGRTRFRFVGDATINADWSAGYLLEIGARYASTTNRSQLSTGAGGNTNSLDIRHSAWYLDSKTFGRVWVGKTSSATDGITEINLSNAVIPGPDVAAGATGGGFRLRASGVKGQAGLSGINRTTGLTGTGTALNYITLTNQASANANVGEGDRNNVIKYVSPTFMGFSLQAAYGEDDLMDIAARYAGEFNSIRVAGGIGYRRVTDFNANATADGTGGCANAAVATAPAAANGAPVLNNNQSAVKCDQIGLSVSAMHIPTGLYVAFAYGQAKDYNRKALFGVGGLDTSRVRDREEMYYLQAGIEQKWLGLGKTTLYGEYFKGYYGSTVTAGNVGFVDVNDPTNSFAAGNARIRSYELELWGLGINQAIDAAAMDLYISYRHYKNDLTLMQQGATSTAVRKSNPLEDYQAVIVGGIIRF